MSHELTYGILASALGRTLICPLEVIRLRMECMDEMLRIGILKIPYTGIWDCIVRTIREEGVRALWRGNSAHVFQGIIAFLVNLVVREILLRIVKPSSYRNKTRFQRYLIRFTSSAVSDVLSLVFTYPFQLSFTKLACDVQKNYQDPMHANNAVRLVDGFSGLFPGLGISMMVTTVYRFILETLLQTIAFTKSMNPEEHSQQTEYISTLIVSAMLFPFGLAKRRMMLAAGTTFKYSDFPECWDTIGTANGPRGYWAGIGAKLLKTVSSSGLRHLTQVYLKTLQGRLA